MPKLKFYRGESLILEPSALSADYSGQVMGENKIAVKLVLNNSFDFMVGDYIYHRGKRYSIADAPTEMRDANNRFTFDLELEAPEYKLYNKQFRHLNSGSFSFTGTAVQMLDLVIQVAGSPWLTGEYEETIIMTVQFEKDSCRTALTKIAEAFGLEYEFTVDFKINLVKSVGSLIPGVVFQYGKGKGLYNLTRQPVSDAAFGTRFFGYGSSENLPANYRNGATELQFEGFYVDTTNIDPDNPIERNAEFPNIKPERTGTITESTNIGNGLWSVIDPSMDFNLNELIVTGEAKIVFKTGFIAGNEFQITKYDNTTKTITFSVNEESSGYILPNDTVKPNAGDTYTFIGIAMPESYIIDAENRLLAATIEYAEANSTPKIAYQLSMDRLFIKNNGLTTALNFGDKIGVKDDPMNTDVILRISNISYSLFDEARINATISEEIIYNPNQQVVKAIKGNANDIFTVERLTEKAKNEADNARRTSQIIAGKTDFLTTTIDGNVVATGTLIVGNAAGDNNAGISGVEEPVIGDSIRFWSGAPYASRFTAPFRVQQDGTVYLNKARIAGDIEIGFDPGSTSSGYTSGWKLSKASILNDAQPVGSIGGNNFAIIRGASKYENDEFNSFSFGTELIPSSTGGAFSQVGRLIISRPELSPTPELYKTENRGLSISATGADINTALEIEEGDLKIGGAIIIDDVPGQTLLQDIGGGFAMRFIKGIFVGTEPI